MRDHTLNIINIWKDKIVYTDGALPLYTLCYEINNGMYSFHFSSIEELTTSYNNHLRTFVSVNKLKRLLTLL